MEKRFVSIWFRHLTTDWFTLQNQELRTLPFVLRSPSHGRMIITALNAVAKSKGISRGDVVADARAIVPDLQVLDDKPDLIGRLLKRLATWCIRFSPVVAIDLHDGLILDATGCSHLWGGDHRYVSEIIKKLNARGYDVRAAMAETASAAWAVARFAQTSLIIPNGHHIDVLLTLPPEALRLEEATVDRLHKLGLHQIRQFISLPRQSLRRRFGPHLLMRLDMALGQEMEMIEPVEPVVTYQERLPCLEPIVTAPGIEFALQQLLETLCLRLRHEQKGIRTGVFKGYRVDGKIEQIKIATNLPSHNVKHLYHLFEINISTIEPSWGIELFVLEAPRVEEYIPQQEKMWEGSNGMQDVRLSELIDRLAGKVGMKAIHRYLPDEHYWPERSYKHASSLQEKLTTTWPTDKLRPLQLMPVPEPIEVTAPIPDYPPMLFRYQNKLHKIMKADGPERIEQEWWLQTGQHRDYYRVEDEDGNRYWLFRLGHYHEETFQWFIHGRFP